MEGTRGGRPTRLDSANWSSFPETSGDVLVVMLSVLNLSNAVKYHAPLHRNFLWSHLLRGGK